MKPNVHCPLLDGHSDSSVAAAEPIGFNPTGTQSAFGQSIKSCCPKIIMANDACCHSVDSQV